MKTNLPSQVLFRNLRTLTASVLCLWLYPTTSALAQALLQNGIQAGQSYHNDLSPALRDLAVFWPPSELTAREEKEAREANFNPKMSHLQRVNILERIVERGGWLKFLGPNIPDPILNFEGISCLGCSGRPNPNGEVGATQYVQTASDAYQVFDKATGTSILGPNSITSLFSGFSGVCSTSGLGEAIVLYDQLANRWLISQLAGTSVPTDACVAVSTTSDATGTYNRYGFHLGSNFFDYPRLSVWPDGYYMSMNVFNSSGTVYLGPQPFAFDRAQMLGGMPATYITTGIAGGPNEDSFLPADLDGSILPPSGAPNSFVEFPDTGIYKIWHFHADFTTPANSTFTLFATPPAASFTPLCPTNRSCVPQLGAGNVDGVGYGLMFRLAYRNFGTPSAPNESLVGNYSVSSNGVAGVRWFELKSVTAGPVTVAQESTYQPDTTWRWLGSAAMDHGGNFAVGFSASSPTIYPQIRYAGRLATDPPDTLAQGEAHLFDGTGSSGSNAWGAYSDLTVDPVDDCTFWYTNEYYDAASSSNWRTRIGNFKFAECTSSGTPTPSPSPAATPTSTPTSTPTPTATPPATPSPTPTPRPTPTPDPCFIIYFTEHFDGVTAPALPADFVTSYIPGPANCIPTGTCALGTNWATSASNPASPPNCAFHDAPGCVTDSNLDTPSFYYNGPSGTSSGAFLSFSHSYDLPSGFDGAVLEISINGGPFTDIIAAGSTFLFGSNGYNGTISTEFQSPIAGRRAWTGNSGGYVQTSVNMPPAAVNQNVRLRFRLATDCSGAGTGWRIDSIDLTGIYPCESPTPTPTVSPSPPPPTKVLNLSTRMRVQTGDNVGIGGFIITGTAPKRVLIRGIGPSLTASGVPDALANPTLDLRNSAGVRILANNDWRDTQEAEIKATGIPPTNNLEAAIVETLDPGSYTVILRGMGMTSGVGSVEIYDLDQGVDSKVANLSTRAFVSTGDNIVIAGFILGGSNGADRIVVRGIGPSLTAFGVANALADPRLELRDGNGALLSANNDWQDNPMQAAELTSAGLAPTNQLESGIATTLPPGLYTALLAGLNNDTGVGLVDVYDRGRP